MLGQHPWPACEKNAGGRYHRYGRTTGLPCAKALRLIRDLLGDRLSCPRCDNARSASRATTLTRCAGISTGMPGPHDFTVRETPAFVQRGAHGHRSPPPRIVTTRTPSAWRRVGRRKAQFLKNGSGIFFARRLYIARRVEGADEIRLSARGFSVRFSGFSRGRREAIAHRFARRAQNLPNPSPSLRARSLCVPEREESS